jgi:hypothetical protein
MMPLKELLIFETCNKDVSSWHQQPKGGGWSHKRAEFLYGIKIRLVQIQIREM